MSTTDPTDPTSNALLQALLTALGAASTASPDLDRARAILLQRLALTGGVLPSRVPGPRNITEIGGWLNLLADAGEIETRTQAIAAALGVAGPLPMPAWTGGPPLFFATRPNQRPAGAPAAVPIDVRIRSDFAAAFDAARKDIADHGAALPLLSPPIALPPAIPGAVPSADLLLYIGRVMEAVPAAALVAPAADLLVLASPAGSDTPPILTARVYDHSAPQTDSVAGQDWDAWTCTSAACTQGTATLQLLDLGPILAAAGWIPDAPADLPTSLLDPGNTFRFRNLTGLVAGRTRYGDELALLYGPAAIAASSLRDTVDWVWDGDAFAAA